jgi:hypothetical protein
MAVQHLRGECHPITATSRKRSPERFFGFCEDLEAKSVKLGVILKQTTKSHRRANKDHRRAVGSRSTTSYQANASFGTGMDMRHLEDGSTTSEGAPTLLQRHIRASQLEVGTVAQRSPRKQPPVCSCAPPTKRPIGFRQPPIQLYPIPGQHVRVLPT